MTLALLSLIAIVPNMDIDRQVGLEIPRDGQRALSVRVTFPKPKGNYPVIVFSHGLYGSEDGNLPLSEHWAKNGYVVIQPTHSDSLRYASAEVRRAAMRGSMDHVQNWRERPADTKLVLDRLSWIEGQVPGLKGKMDREKIGMGGHSYGAWTTQVVAGMTLSGLSLADPRPDAFFALAPHGMGGGITEASYKTMRGPMLYVTGDNDKGRFEGDPKVYRRQAYDHSPAGGRTLVWIDGAYHNFGGVSGRSAQGRRTDGLTGPANEQHVKWVQEASLQFWNDTLKVSASAKAFWKDPFAGERGIRVEQK